MNRNILQRAKRVLSGEEGVTLVEMAICTSVLMAMLLGIFQFSLVLYNFQLAADAARDASRFAMVRGNLCPINVNQAYCSPSASNATGATDVDVSSFVQSLGFMGRGHLTASTSWLVASAAAPTTWSACSTAPCNVPGNQVRVTVTYNYPLNIPFAPSFTIPISSTSTEVITQ